MGICVLGVSEDGVGQPDESDHVTVQSQSLHGAVVAEAAVRPRLGEDDVDLVFLTDRRGRRVILLLRIRWLLVEALRL